MRQTSLEITHTHTLAGSQLWLEPRDERNNLFNLVCRSKRLVFHTVYDRGIDGKKSFDFYRRTVGVNSCACVYICMPECVIQRDTYPSWHILCSGGFSLTLSHAAREQQGLGAGIMQDALPPLPPTLSFTCIASQKVPVMPYIQPASAPSRSLMGWEMAVTGAVWHREINTTCCVLPP